MAKLNNPPFPYSGILCLLLGGLLLLYGGMKFGGILVGLAIAWTAIALLLKMRRQ